MGARFFLFAIVLTVFLGGAHHARSLVADPLERSSTAPRRTEHAPVGKLRGAGSCSSVACHGSAAPTGRSILGNEHTTWATQDKHSNAYLVLFTDRSRAIANALGIDATRSERCLGCHATPARGASRAATFGDGVSCEACHGSAEKWIGPHTEDGWESVSPAVKEQRFGLFATKDLSRRAAVCAGCHVGSPAKEDQIARDVNHDLIAAGHPALRFEFSAYLALIAPHWTEKGRNAQPDFAARAWAVGQVVCAKAALDVLQDRAARSQIKMQSERTPWPELSDYSCFSCHQDLTKTLDHSTEARSRESLTWRNWNLTLIAELAERDPGVARGSIKRDHDALSSLMNSTEPNPEDVSRCADRLAHSLDRWSQRLDADSLDARWIQDVATAISAPRESASGSGWDADAQRYLATVALQQSLRRLVPNERLRSLDRPKLERIRDALKFKVGFESPRD